MPGPDNGIWPLYDTIDDESVPTLENLQEGIIIQSYVDSAQMDKTNL